MSNAIQLARKVAFFVLFPLVLWFFSYQLADVVGKYVFDTGTSVKFIEKYVQKQPAGDEDSSRSLTGARNMSRRLILSSSRFKMANQTQERRLQQTRYRCINTYYIRPLTPEINDLKRYSQIYYFRERFKTTFINDDYKLLLTFVYKTGSENWRKLFQQIFEKGQHIFQQQFGAPDGIYTLDKLYNKSDGIQQVAERLKNYFSVIFVRHPYSRILSAYLSKYVNIPNTFYADKARYIISKVRRIRKKKFQINPVLQFEELVEYITNGGYDEHWCPIFKEKRPCHLLFDFIGHLETFDTDIRYLFHLLGIEGTVEYPQSSQRTGSSDSTVLKKYFSKVSQQTFQKLNDIYKDDFIFFGYRLPQNNSDFDDMV